MCSRGTPMFLAGDEFGNTQFGNNNSYCQDNEISWLDWSLLEKNKEIFEFFRYMIAFRQQHSVIRGNTAPCSCGFPPMSLHCIKAWDSSYVWDTRFLGVMFSGIDSTGRDDIVYLGINTFWKPLQIELPALPSSKYWIPAVDTGRGDMSVITEEEILDKSVYVMNPRSVLVCVVRDRG